MTSKNTEQQTLQMRLIHRTQVQQSIALAASFALLLSSCGSNSRDYSQDGLSVNGSDATAVNDQNANEEIQAVFYETTEQCEVDVQKQQDEYAVLLTAFEGGTLAEEPTAPALQPDDCGPQMLAAQEEHAKHAPAYASLEDCQAEGLECEPSTDNQSTSHYRPRFGGSYFYPYGGRTEYIYVNYGGTQRQVYQPRTVYQSNIAGQVVTPHGQVVTKTNTGTVTAPLHTTVAAPQRPAGTAARGTITGRSSQGFGSTYKSTGRGGK